MKKNSINMFLCIVLSMLYSCTPGNLKYTEYVKWLEKPENGLIQEKFVNGLHLKVKYLPTDYLVYRECQSCNAKQIDSLVEYYNKSMSFILIISPDEREEKKPGNILMSGISDYSEYKARIQVMNFAMEEMVSINTGKVNYSPVLYNLENSYELDNKTKILFVFNGMGNVNLRDSDHLDFTFRDEIFDTGINHFVFERGKIENIPDLIFNKI